MLDQLSPLGAYIAELPAKVVHDSLRQVFLHMSGYLLLHCIGRFYAENASLSTSLNAPQGR